MLSDVSGDTCHSVFWVEVVLGFDSAALVALTVMMEVGEIKIMTLHILCFTLRNEVGTINYLVALLILNQTPSDSENGKIFPTHLGPIQTRSEFI